METSKRTELIENIIKQFYPDITPDTTYSRDAVKVICELVWHTANNELDEICELKEDNKCLQMTLYDLEKIILTNDKQIQKQLSEIEKLKLEYEELNQLYVDSIANYNNLESEMKAELEAEYQRGRNDEEEYQQQKEQEQYED